MANAVAQAVAAERERWAKYADEKSANMDAFTRRARGNVVKPNEWDVLAAALRAAGNGGHA